MDKHSADLMVWISAIIGTLVALSRARPIGAWIPLSMSTDSVPNPSKKVWVWSVWIVIAVVSGTFVVLKNSSPPRWHPFHSSGGYTVQMPGDVTEQTYTKTVQGRDATAWEVTAKSNDCVFITGYCNSAAGLPSDSSLEADEFAKKAGDLLVETPVTVDGHNGTEAIIRTSDHHNVTARFFSEAGRDYFLILSTTDQTANDPNVQAFIPSFHFDANADATASARS